MSEEKANKFAKKPKSGLTLDVDKAKFVEPKGEKAEKPKKVKVEKAPKAEGGKKGRVSIHAGKKIVKLAKEHGAREGTVRAALLSAVMGAKKVDDVLGTEVKAGDKTAIVSSNDLNYAIENSLIKVA